MEGLISMTLLLPYLWLHRYKGSQFLMPTLCWHQSVKMDIFNRQMKVDELVCVLFKSQFSTFSKQVWPRTVLTV